MVKRFKHRFYTRWLVICICEIDDPDKRECSGYGIRFDACSQFLFSNDEQGKNVVIFGVDNSSSTHTDNKKKIS